MKLKRWSRPATIAFSVLFVAILCFTFFPSPVQIGHLSFGGAGVASATTETFTTSGYWICLAGVSVVTVEVWGGGGGGGSSGSTSWAGGGGGGGAYSKANVTVTLGGNYSYTVGGAGIRGVHNGGTTAGGSGGDSYWEAGAVVLAKGGGGGGAAVSAAGTAGIGGAKANGKGSVTTSGGNGLAGSSTYGGGGGGSGGTSLDGITATGQSGAAAVEGGGNGGGGGAAHADGVAPTTPPGGGGGGEGHHYTGNFYGGVGLAGKIIITYTIYPITIDTLAASDITTTSATLNGNVTSIASGGNVTSYGFVLSTSTQSNPGNVSPSAQTTYTAGNWTWTGVQYEAGQTFQSSYYITSLNKGTCYYFRAAGYNTAGWIYGNELTFPTLSDAPTNCVSVGNQTNSIISWTWTNGVGYGNTSWRYRTDGIYPTSITDGTSAYLGNGTSATVIGLRGITEYYLAGWSISASCGGATSTSGSSCQLTITTLSPATYIVAGTYSWTCPATVYMVTAQVWGGGGGGGASDGTGQGGGGGGGGAYSSASIQVTPGGNYTVVVGDFGVSGDVGAPTYGYGGPGGQSYFSTTGTVQAGGGNGGFPNTLGGAGGLGGTAGAGTGYSGGAGAQGYTSNSGGGGEGSGNTTTGTAGTRALPGLGGTGTDGGDGGDGGQNTGLYTNFGLPGTPPGGGGGGGYDSGAADGYGGDGALGKVVINYTIPLTPTIAALTTTSISSVLATLNGNITTVGAGNVTVYGAGWDIVSHNTYLGNVTPGSCGYTGNWTYDGTVNYGVGQTFSHAITGLRAGTKYYFKVAGYNTDGWGWSPESSFYTGYDNSFEITTDDSVVDGNLTDFSLTIFLGSSSGITNADTTCVFDELLSDTNRFKIAITDGVNEFDGSNLLSIEIEKWDTSSETAVLHVAADVREDVSVSLWFYYDIDASDNTYVKDIGDKHDVWDANYKAVLHQADFRGLRYSIYDNIFRLTASSEIHTDYGLSYPVTYKFSIPVGLASGGKAYHRHSDSTTVSWSQLTTKTTSDFFNAVEAVRFDYTNHYAYVSVAFDVSYDEIYIKITNSSDATQVITFVEVPKYYDNRVATFAIVDDDFEELEASHITGYDILQARNIWLTSATVTYYGGVNYDYTLMQAQIDEGYIELADHSWTHTYIPYADYYKEIVYSKMIDLGWNNQASVYRQGTTDYMWIFAGPGGFIDDLTRRYERLGRYLVDMDGEFVGNASIGFTSWDSEEMLFGTSSQYAFINDNWPGITNTATLNGYWDSVYSQGGIYILRYHGHWIANYATYFTPHMDYLKNKTDVWYTGFGAMYMYHFVEQMVNAQDVFGIVDSTSNGLMAAKKTNTESAETNGLLGKAQDYTGDDYNKVFDSSSLSLTTAGTIEAVVKLDSVATQYILAKGNSSSIVPYSLSYDGATSKFKFGYYTGGTWTTISTSDTYGAGTYYYVVGRYDGTNLKIYVDGVEKGSTAGSTLPTNTADLFIGAYDSADNKTDYLDGTVDEIRISSTARSADYIKTNFNNLTDNLLTFIMGGPDISNTPSSKNFGVVQPSHTYWAIGAAPSWPLADGNCTETVTNNSSFAVNILYSMSNMTGGTTWTIGASPASNVFTVKVFKSGAGNITVCTILSATPQEVIHELAAGNHTHWEFVLYTPTNTPQFADGTLKSGTMTLAAEVH